MQFRLILDRDQIDRCRKIARELAGSLAKYSLRHTSVAIEEATLRAMGVHGHHKNLDLAEVVIDRIGRDRLREGAAYWLGAVMVERNCTPLLAAKHIAKEGFPDRKGEKLPHGEIRKMARASFAAFFQAIAEAKAQRQSALPPQRWGADWQLMMQLHTGNMERDVKKVRDFAADPELGSVVVRSPLPSTSAQLVGRGRGWRATYDLLHVIDRLDHAVREMPKSRKRPFAVMWNGLSLAAPSLAVALAKSHLAGMEYDCLSLTHVEGVHMKRAIVDQTFIYQLLAKAGLSVSVGSDRWTSLVDGYTHGHELLMGQLLIEAMGEGAGFALEQVSARHSLVIPRRDEGYRSYLIDEIAHAQLLREFFPQVPLEFALSAAHDIATATMIATLCGFSCGMLDWNETDKAHVAKSEAAKKQIMQLQDVTASLGTELTFVANGNIARRANMLTERMTRSLQQMQRRDLLRPAEAGAGRGLFSFTDEGAGIDGVLQRHKYYCNPLLEWIAP